MRVYCLNKNCPKKPKGYAICTALMSPKECPERKEKKQSEENSENNRNVSV